MQFSSEDNPFSQSYIVWPMRFLGLAIKKFLNFNNEYISLSLDV